jgi:hypothetical protein
MSKKYESNRRLRDKWLHNDEVDDYLTFLQQCLEKHRRRITFYGKVLSRAASKQQFYS